MAEKIEKTPDGQANGEDQGLPKKHILADLGQPNTKRKRFMALLNQRYGYTNEKSVDEMERLLKQFYITNKSLGIFPARRKYDNPPGE